jgi:hypothetical protein
MSTAVSKVLSGSPKGRPSLTPNVRSAVVRSKMSATERTLPRATAFSGSVVWQRRPVLVITAAVALLGSGSAGALSRTALAANAPARQAARDATSPVGAATPSLQIGAFTRALEVSAGTSTPSANTGAFNGHGELALISSDDLWALRHRPEVAPIRQWAVCMNLRRGGAFEEWTRRALELGGARVARLSAGAVGPALVDGGAKPHLQLVQLSLGTERNGPNGRVGPGGQFCLG